MKEGSGENAQYRRMMETPIPRLVTSMAVPTIISMLVTVIYNTADTFFVSQIDKSASAAVGAVYAIMALIQALGCGLGVGAGNLISLKLGAKDKGAANKYASSAFFAAIGVGVAIMAVGLAFLTPILRLLGCSETMMPHAIPYARFILIGAPLNCATFVLNTSLRNEGHARLAMIGIGTGGVLNVFLDPLFIFTLGMGTGGASLATMVSQMFSFVILSVIFLTGHSVVKIHPRHVSRRFSDYRMIIATGMPTVFRQGLSSVASAALNIQAIAYGGDAAGAAITIANKVYILVRNISLGFGQGFQPVAGYNFGAGRRRRTWQAFTFTVWVGTAICAVFSVVSILFAAPIMGWFSRDPDVLRIGTETILISGVAMPFLAMGTYVNMLYQGLGFKGRATLLASCRQGIFFLPAVLLLPLGFGCLGVQAAQPVADLCTFAVALPFAIAFYRRYVRGQSDTPTA